MQLLERETQLQVLDDALREVISGTGRIALIYGEAGIGKTSLVEHFLGQHKDSSRILRGACESLFTPRPLGPLHDIAAQTRGPLLELLESAADRGAIFAASLAELGSQPTILLVEDIHWADEATLDWLKYFGRRIRPTSCLLLLTYRDDELPPEHPLRRLLGDLGASASTHRVPVAALSPKAVLELAHDRPLDAAELHRRTNGNPFFVTEVLATQGGIPETVRDAVLARAAHLSDPARRALEAGAILGPRFEPSLLSGLAGEDSAHVDECFAAGMLQADSESYSFRHVLSRETILESIPMPRRIELHRMVLRLLKDSPGPRADLARLAYHADGAHDSAAVLEYGPAAARQASAASSHREAIALYELSLRFADQLPGAQHAQMLDEYISELAFAGKFDACVDSSSNAIALWAAAGEPIRQGESLANLGTVLHLLGRRAESEEAAGAAVALLEALPETPELALAYKTMCFICKESREIAGAISWGRLAIDLAERLGNADTLARACNYTGCVTMLVDYDRGRALMERSLEIGLRENLPFAVGGTLSNLSEMLVEIFLPAAAHPILQKGIEYTTDHDDDYHLGSLLTLQALALFHQGKWEQARTAMPSALGNAGTDLLIRADGGLVLARLAVREGDPEAASSLDQIIATYGPMDLVVQLGALRAARAEYAWLAGDNPRAAREARASYDIVVAKQHPWIAGELAFWRWRAGDDFPLPAWIASPYATQIAGDWRAAAAEWEQRDCPYEQGMALMDGDEAAQLEALQIFERLGARPIMDKLKQQMRAQGVRGIPRGPRPSTRENAFGLTARELQVLGSLVQGSSNSTIARQLSLSTRTVEHHIASIFQKTGTQSRGEAVALALRDNLVPDS